MIFKKRHSSAWIPAVVSLSLIILFVSFLVAFNSIYGMLFGFKSSTFHGLSRPSSSSINMNKRVNVLIVGVDAPSLKEGARSDVMILIQYDPKAKNLKMMSLPRDTRVILPEFGEVKLNSVNNYQYNPAFSTSYLIKTIEEFLDLKIHAYVKTNFQGFAKIIDILGGIWLDVEKDMYYYEPVDGYKVDLKKGYQLLNGEKALQYVRFRADLADFAIRDGKPAGRVGRQAKFLKAIIKEASSSKNWLKLGQVMDAAKNAIETDLSPQTIVSLASAIKYVNLDCIQALAFPGFDAMVSEISYIEPDYIALEKMITEKFKDEPPQITTNP
jgi:LCP family protein required for cell wall assembly